MIRRVVTSRRGGASHGPFASFNLATHVGDDHDDVEANRRRLATEIGVQLESLTWMEQVHGRSVRVVTSTQSAPVEMVDALVTSTPGVVLSVLVADCVPMLMWDDTVGVVAAVHAGRRGVRLGIADEVLGAMQGLGAAPAAVQALIGPAICGACYEVPADMQADVEAHAPGSASTTAAGTPGLDLRAGLVQQLRTAGVSAIGVDPRCTYEDLDLFSYRRDGGTTGRQAGVVWIE